MAYGMVAIGTSWGGLRALGHILPSLPSDFPAPIVVVQHRRANSPRDAMSSLLSTASSLPVREVEDKDPIEPGHVYLAPPDYHLIVEPGHLALSTEAAVENARPSVDVLFESAADSYGSSLIACVLTGMNDDGARGLAAVKANGGYVLVQHPDSAERTGMPDAAIATGLADRVLPLADIAAELATLVGTAARESMR